MNSKVRIAVVRSMELDPTYNFDDELGYFLRNMQRSIHDEINERLMLSVPKNLVTFWHDELESRAEKFADKYELEYSDQLEEK